MSAPAAPLAGVLGKLRSKTPVTIVVVGDSNTIVSMNTQGRMNWVGYLTEALWERYGDGLVTMINVSECGYSFIRLQRELDRKLLRWQPDLVIFLTWLTSDETPEAWREAEEAFTDCVSRLRAAAADTDVLVCTPHPKVYCTGHPLPPGAVAGEAFEDEHWNTRRNARFIELARSCGCATVDHFEAWKGKRYSFAHPGANPRGLWQRMADPIHPNAAGHMALFREMAPVFDVAPTFLWEESPEPAPGAVAAAE